MLFIPLHTSSSLLFMNSITISIWLKLHTVHGRTWKTISIVFYSSRDFSCLWKKFFMGEEILIDWQYNWRWDVIEGN